MSIKKSYIELVSFLEENQNKKVSSILEEVQLMCSSKRKDATVIYKDDKPFAIFCYYHKQWELVENVEYGSKKNTQSGLNTMCKVGVSSWTKAQKVKKQSKEKLLIDVSNGTIDPTDLITLMDDIDNQCKVIDTTDMPTGCNYEDVMLLV